MTKFNAFWRLLFTVNIILLLSHQEVLCQSEKRVNKWYFGRNAGLDFDSGEPKPLTDGALNIWEGCATICDENGALLFYTDGRSIWSKNHQIIPGAIDLGGDNSSSQSGVIVPQPNTPNIYFVFSVDAEGGGGGLQYAVVDITLNAGLGGVISKNNRLLASASEKLTVVRHCNNVDFWVIAHELYSNSFSTYLLTKGGLSTAFQSKIGSVHGGGADAIGYMKASSQGNKIAVCSWGEKSVELFDFDNTTGLLSNNIIIQSNYLNYVYGAEFSPNSKFLYISTAETKAIYQFEVDVANAVGFEASRVYIGGAEKTQAAKIGALQMASNGRIYVALDETSYLGVINKPDLKGALCGYQEKGVELAGRESGLGLPNLITSYFKIKPSVVLEKTIGNNCNEVTLTARLYSTAQKFVYQWYLDNQSIPGAEQDTYIPVQSGNYKVTVKEVGSCINDSMQSKALTIHIIKFEPKLISSKCGSVRLVAGANGPVAWSGVGVEPSKAASDSITIFGKGQETFTVRAFDPLQRDCFIDKSVNVTFSENQAFNLEKNNVVACDSVILQASQNSDWDTFRWIFPDGSMVSTNNVIARQSGKFIVNVSNIDGCMGKDSVEVKLGNTPEIKTDEYICMANNFFNLDAGASGQNLSYHWAPNGEITSKITVSTPGIYKVNVSSAEGCSASRIFELSTPPRLGLGDDLIGCKGTNIELVPTLANVTADATFEWSSGETTQNLTVSQSGTYVLSIIQGACHASDSVEVRFNALPIIKPDETICLKSSIDAGDLEPNLTYEWQHSNEINNTISITEEGIYEVKITNNAGCSASRKITVKGLCQSVVLAPDAFTPDGNGPLKNEIFRVSVLGGEIIQLDIFDRWGKQIFKDTSTNPKWDGGSSLPGIYPYVLRYRSTSDGHTVFHRGSVLLLK